MPDGVAWRKLIGISISLLLFIFAAGCVDCAWYASVEAWVDENANGIWDEGEPPLEGVEFHVDDVLNGYTNMGNAISDWKGIARISLWLPGCPKARFEVYAEPPTGYRLTTDARLPAEGEGYGGSGPFRFGFAPLPGFSTPTPHTRSLQCRAWNPGAQNFGLGPDGSVWAVSWDGVSLYDPVRSIWHAYEIDLPDGQRPYDEIIIGGDGVIWIMDQIRSLARFAESDWTIYTEEEKLIPGSDPSIGAAPDGTVWFVFRDADLVGFHPGTDSWKLYCGERSSQCGAGYTAKAITDGSVWFGSNGDRSAYGPPDAAGPVTWEVTDRHTFAAGEIRETPIAGRIQDVEIAPDGKLWIAYSFGVARFDPRTERWQTYDSDTTGGVLSTLIWDLALAPDGSVWMASSKADHALAYRFDPEYEGSEQGAWRTYDPREGIPELSGIYHIAVGNDGSIWLGFDTVGGTMAQCSFLKP
jgi:streptogramin lyase